MADATHTKGRKEIKPPRPGHQRRDIQGLRAIAVLAVVAFHAGLPVPGGFVGVDVFFVISGFVITAMLQRECSATGRIRFGRFYLRRFKRLTPALALMITGTLLISFVLLSPLGPQQTAAQTAIGAMLFVANVVIERTTGGYFGTAAEINPLLNTWSLSVEEQFYFIFPVLIAVSWYVVRRHVSLHLTPYFVVGTLAVSSFALATLSASGLTFRGSTAILGFYSPIPRAWEFAVGALLALAINHRPPLKSKLTGPAGVLGLLLLAGSFWFITDATPFPGPWTLLPVAGTLLLLFAGTSPQQFTSRLLSTSAMVKFGDWSYSIYLWHWPFIVFASLLVPGASAVLPIAAALSLVPALASYRWVEQPIRGLDRLPAFRWGALVVLTISVPLAVAGALWVGAASGYGSERIRQFQAATLPFHAGAQMGCDTRAPLGQSQQCIWNARGSGSPVYLVGDSNADHFSEGIITAAGQSQRPVVIGTTNSCPFGLLAFEDLRDGVQNASCTEYRSGSIAYLQGAEPGLVVISNADGYWRSSDYGVGTSSETLWFDEPRKIEALKVGLIETVGILQASGHEVLLIQTVPQWGEGGAAWDPGRCSIPAILSGSCGSERPLADALANSQSVRATIEAVARVTGATVWDPGLDLCPLGTCSITGPDYIRYRDAGHISVPQSEALADRIQALFDAVRIR